MKIVPNSQTIEQLFKSSKEQFHIPAYQRRYAWGKKELRELFEDINVLKENETHFFGTILFLTEPHKAGINCLEVVDGQQRLISISILLKVIQNRFSKLKEEDVVKEIEEYYLFCKDINRKKEDKIILGDLDELDYRRALNEESVDQVKNKRLLDAFEEFKRYVSKFNKEQLNIFYDKLTKRTTLVRLDVEKEKEAYRLFATINDRGLKLNSTDIIKNFLLGNASLIDDNVLRIVRGNWRDLIVTLDNINPDSYFRHYLTGTLQEKIPFSRLTEIFKRYYLSRIKEANLLSEYKSFYRREEPNPEEETEESYEEETEESYEEETEESYEEETEEVQESKIIRKKKIPIINFSDILKENSKIYSKIVNCNFDNPKVNKHLTNLKQIGSIPSYIFLLNLFQRNLDDKITIKILKLIETFMLRRQICEVRTFELDGIFAKLIKLKDDNLLVKIKEELIKDLPTDKEFEDKFAKYDFKGNTKKAKYILEQLNYNLTNEEEFTLNMGGDVHLEHIIPQKIDSKKVEKEYGNWVTYLGKNSVKKYKKYIDRIGNYTLLGQKLNITASNNPFLAKKKEYLKSSIEITKKIAKEYDQFKFEEVEKRSKELANTAKEIWKM